MNDMISLIKDLNTSTATLFKAIKAGEDNIIEALRFKFPGNFSPSWKYEIINSQSVGTEGENMGIILTFKSNAYYKNKFKLYVHRDILADPKKFIKQAREEEALKKERLDKEAKDRLESQKELRRQQFLKLQQEFGNEIKEKSSSSGIRRID